MRVTRTSLMSGEHTMDLPVTQDQLDELARPGPQRRLVQDIFPDVSAGGCTTANTMTTLDHDHIHAAFRRILDDFYSIAQRASTGTLPVYEVYADAVTGEWLDTPVPTGARVLTIAWESQQDRDDTHFDCYMAPDGEYRAIIVHWMREAP